MASWNGRNLNGSVSNAVALGGMRRSRPGGCVANFSRQTPGTIDVSISKFSRRIPIVIRCHMLCITYNADFSAVFGQFRPREIKFWPFLKSTLCRIDFEIHSITLR